jgi:CubicO group peptidase (beta-lactamase class C family)
MLCVGLGRPLGAQTLASLDSVVPALMKKYDVPGVALVVVRGDSVLALKGYGVARVRDSARVDPTRTLFRLASVSKLFVATAVMQQVEAGKVALDADVNRYLDFRIRGPWPQPITLDHLLTHTAGFDERLIGYAAHSRDSVGDLGAHLAANLPYRGWPPGAVIGYSNYGVALAAHVVERTSGLPFDRYARERIFIPLGMHRTFYVRVPDSLRADVAEGHFCDATSCDSAPDVFSHPYPVGLAYSSAADMAQFLIAQLGNGASPVGRALDSATVALMQRQHFTADPGLPGMSYVFFNQRNGGHRLLAHAGNVPGINNLLFIVPDARLGVYFVANGGRSTFGAALRDVLLSTLVQRTPAPQPSPAVALDERYLRSLTGAYQITRYAHRSIESFPLIFATSVSLAIHGQRLALPYPNGAVEFEPLDSLHFREVDGERLIAFRRDASGRVTRLFAPIPVFGAELPGVLERRAWYDGAHFLNEYVSWLVLGPLLVFCGVWPIAAGVAWWYRRRQGAHAAHGSRRAERTALGAALAFNALWICFGFGVIARSTRMLERATGIVYGVTPLFRLAAVVPWILAVMSVFIVVAAVLSWPRGSWGPLRRVLYGLVAVGAVLIVAFLVRWNYLPMRF